MHPKMNQKKNRKRKRNQRKKRLWLIINPTQLNNQIKERKPFQMEEKRKRIVSFYKFTQGHCLCIDLSDYHYFLMDFMFFFHLSYFSDCIFFHRKNDGVDIPYFIIIVLRYFCAYFVAVIFALI